MESQNNRQRADNIAWGQRFDQAQPRGPLKVTDQYFQDILNNFREKQKAKEAGEKRERELKGMVAEEEEVPKKRWWRRIGLGRLGKPRH